MISFPKIPKPYENIDYSAINQNISLTYDDGESPIELMQSSNEYLKNTVPALEQIAQSSKIQSDLALEKSKKADIKGWLAIIISLFALALELIVNRSEIAIFITEILQ